MLYTTTTHTYILLLSNCTKRSRKKFQTLCTPPCFRGKKNNTPPTTWRKRKKGGTLPPKRYNIIPPKKYDFARGFPGPNHSPVQHFPVPWVNWELFLEEWCICMWQTVIFLFPFDMKNYKIKTKNSSDFFWCICIIIKTKSFRTQI